jgi:hypothetical protein
MENGRWRTKVRQAHDRATPRLKNSGACRKERLLLRLRSRSGFRWWGNLSRLDLVRVLVSRRYRRYIFGSIGFVHRSLGLVVATISTGQSGTAEQGYDTQYHDETKDSLHIGLLLCVGCASGSCTLPQTLLYFPRHVKRPGSGTAASTQRRDAFYCARTCGNTSRTQCSSCPN